jgi:hypothetical protein
MKNFIFLPLFILLFVSASVTAQTSKKTTFSSAYTNLGRGCLEIPGENGTDGGTICRGPARYQVRVYYSAATTQINAEIRDKDDNFPLATLSIDFDHTKTKVEWRLANGKPFAAIIRVPTYADPVGDEQYFGKVNGEELRIIGLKGHQKIEGRVNAKTADANAKARELADAAYSKD